MSKIFFDSIGSSFAEFFDLQGEIKGEYQTKNQKNSDK